MKSWPDQIRRYRRVHGLTQTTLGEMLGVEQATISRWERGSHQPELGIQRRLRDMFRKCSHQSDSTVLHRTLNAIAAVKIADRAARNVAASQEAARLHGLPQKDLSICNYYPFFTEILDKQWNGAISNGFFAGEIAGVRVYNTWQPAGGLPRRFCFSHWSPIWFSDGEILLVSEFKEIEGADFLRMAEPERFHITSMDEILI